MFSASLLLSCSTQPENGAIFIKTFDKRTISADVRFPGQKGPFPVVILIHQGNSNRQEWNFLLPELNRGGYAVINYDIRGYGNSQKVGNLVDLYTNPKRAPRDLEAVLQYIKDNDYFDSSKIAVVGSSIGGNLALSLDKHSGVNSRVVLSVKTTAARALASGRNLFLENIYYITSRDDQDGLREQWAKELYEKTGSKRKITIHEGDEHGVSIILRHPKIKEEIIKWLSGTL